MSGYFDHLTGKFIYVEDMEPELVVPDLTDFQVNRLISMEKLNFMFIIFLVEALHFV